MIREKDPSDPFVRSRSISVTNPGRFCLSPGNTESRDLSKESHIRSLQ